MRAGSVKLIASTLFIVLGCTSTERPAAAAAEEIIVKFAADQAINETIAHASNDMAAESSLGEYVQKLSQDTGVPMQYSRLTSGREIVIEISRKGVYDHIVNRLRRAAQVETLATEWRATSKAPNAVDEILIALKDGNDDIGGDVVALGAQLVDDERFPVLCEARSDGRLAMSPDFDQLVKNLVDALGRRSDVEYAQANFRVRHYSK